MLEAIRQNLPSRVSRARVDWVMWAAGGSTRSDFSSIRLALVASTMLTVAGCPSVGSFRAGTAISLFPSLSIRETGPAVFPTTTDEITLPLVMLNEMREPAVTEEINPILPLAAITG
jgi:hypothetical protein